MRTIHTVTTESEDKEKYYEEDESLVDAQERYYGEAEMFSEIDKIALAVWGKTQAKNQEKREGYIERKDFKTVFKGTLPESTQRIRKEKPNTNDSERLAYDVVLSAPKSVSMALHLEEDLRVFDAHMEAVQETLEVIEKELAMARIQVNGQRQVVKTGNLIAALLPHHTSREGDMQLHTHTLIMNGTKCPDGEWRALWKEPLTQAQWVGGFYRQKLAEKMQELGYRIYNTEHGFELSGYSPDDLKLFSKRNQEIVKAVVAEGLSVNAQNKKDKVLTTRKAKSKTGKSLENKQEEWREEGQSHQVGHLERVHPIKIQPNQEAATESVNSAIRHLSERSVSFSRNDIYSYVFQRIYDGGRDFEQIYRAIDEQKFLIDVGNDRFTTVEAMEREIETVKQWMAGQGKALPLLANPNLEETRLNTGQKEAIARTLTSTDTNQIIHGLSGVGKTTALGELKRQLQKTKIEIKGFSPTIEAAAELQKELGIPTNTVERLVLSEPQETKNQLWIIDEAGMTSARQMQSIVQKADRVGARILLVGDKGQNSSIEAGNPLRSLIEHGATTHSLRQIIRQQNSIQKQAVELIASGNGAKALELLNNNGYVTQIESKKDRAGAIASQYLALSQKERERTLIVAGTNAERLSITKTIREGLKTEGKLYDQSIVVQLVSRQFTTEQSKHVKNYQVGDYIRLHREYQSTPLKKRQFYKVEECRENELTVSSSGGRLYRFNPSQFKDKEVFYAKNFEIAVGDNLRWTTTKKEKRHINGQQFKVTAIEGTTMTVSDRNGQTQSISLLEPLAIDYNLVTTSYRAQGKTAHRVIVSATSDPTSSREPFYIKISRQTKELDVYTQDLQNLRKWVERSNAQQNPLELLQEHGQRNDIDGHTNPVIRDRKTDGQLGKPMPSHSRTSQRSIERLCGAINRTAIAETIGELRDVVEGIDQLNQQLRQGITNRSELTRKVRNLGESLERTNRTVNRQADGTQQRLVEAIAARQIGESLQLPLLELKKALKSIKSDEPDATKVLVEQIQGLQQTVGKIEQNVSHAIREEKLNTLAKTIAAWKATQSIHAQDSIYKALQTFNKTSSDITLALWGDRERLNSAVQNLRSTLKETTLPQKAEVFWQPEYPHQPPEHINPHHWEQFKSSAIHPDLITLNAESISGTDVYERLLSEKLAKLGSGQYTTVPMSRELRKYEGVAEGGWWGNAGIDAMSLVTLNPGEQPNSTLWGCYKPDSPRIDVQKSDRKGKTEFLKYESPASTPRVSFLPKVPDSIAEKIYQKYKVNPTSLERQSGFWFVVKEYPQIPITITEGFKKTLSSLSQGEVTIGLTGTNHIYSAKDANGNKLHERQLNAEVAVFAVPNREFRIAFDSDTKPRTICNVRRDLVRGVELLQAKGSTVRVVKWDSSDGKGLDDLIVQKGADAYRIAQQNAVSPERDKRTHYRTEYNKIAKKITQTLGTLESARLDLEVYLKAIEFGEIADGIKTIAQSDRARALAKQNNKNAEHYAKALASVAGTYSRLSERQIKNLDTTTTKLVRQQMVAFSLEEEKALTHTKNNKPHLSL